VGESGTKDAILLAARSRFASCGYDRATVRAIASAAGVDAALVHHFYGTKERLFVAAMRFPVVPSELLSGLARTSRGRVGELLARAVLEPWEDPEVRAPGMGLLRSAVSNDVAAKMLREFVSRAILRPIAETLQAPDAAFRASLVASQIVGVLMTRFVVGIEPIASVAVDDLVVAIGPTLQRYLTGPVRRPG